MAIDKNWALNQLRHARNSYVIALAGIRLVNSPSLDTLQGRMVVLKPDSIIFDPDSVDRQGKRYEVLFDQIISSRDNQRSEFEYDLETAYKLARRSLVKESFEYAKAYAKQTGKLSSFKAEPWYAFVRLIRNALSHDFHFRFDARAAALLPVAWDGHIIDTSMDGQELAMLTPHLAVTIASELEAFVKAN